MVERGLRPAMLHGIIIAGLGAQARVGKTGVLDPEAVLSLQVVGNLRLKAGNLTLDGPLLADQDLAVLLGLDKLAADLAQPVDNFRGLATPAQFRPCLDGFANLALTNCCSCWAGVSLAMAR